MTKLPTALEAWLDTQKSRNEYGRIHPETLQTAIAVIEKLKSTLEVYTCPHCANVGDSDQCYEYQSCRALSNIDPEKL